MTGVTGLIHMNPRITAGTTRVFHKALNAGGLVYGTASEYDVSYTFNASMVNDYNSLANVFDSYRITKIYCNIHANSAPITSAVSTTPAHSQLIAAIDFDDSATSTAAALRDYDNVIVLCPGQSGTFSFEPMATGPAYTSAGAATQTQLIRGAYYDWATPAVAYYGAKMAATAQLSGTIYHSWFVEFTCDLECRFAR
jgi:hypothetical protein